LSEVRAELADTAHKLAVAKQQHERDEERHHHEVEDLRQNLDVAKARLEEQSRVLEDERSSAAHNAAHNARLLATIEIQQESLAQYRADTAALEARCEQLEADLAAAEDESARQVVACDESCGDSEREGGVVRAVAACDASSPCARCLGS
jgi:chromosome segregation ATPase